MARAQRFSSRRRRLAIPRRRECDGNVCLVGALVSELTGLGDFDDVALVVAAVADCDGDGCWAASVPSTAGRVVATIAVTEAGRSVLPPARGALPLDDGTTAAIDAEGRDPTETAIASDGSLR